MIDPRAELIKRVTNAVNDLRQELINAGVDPKALADSVMVEETADGVAVHFFFDYSPKSKITVKAKTQQAVDEFDRAIEEYKKESKG